ncbi:MAG: hypothetical protein NC828_06410, partial [Candidatus Omnitrophica bacterium]|nr:hypothetical protein [Candidatus Omnitrophota bacterium]
LEGIIMEKQLKFMFSALLVTSMIFLISAVALFFMRQAEIEKRIVLQRDLDVLNKEKTRIAKELDETIIAKKDLEIKLSTLQEKAALIEKQIEEEKRLRESLFSQLETEKRESKRLVEELTRLKDEKARLTTDFENIKTECATLKMQLESVQQAKEIVEGRLKEVLAKNEIELEKIIVKPKTGLASAGTNPTKQPNLDNTVSGAGQKNVISGAKGEVLVINKKYDFAVVNLGENDGLEVGMNLGIYRDGRLLAVLVVEKVHTSMAAAKIPPEWKSADIKEGDTVVVVQ